MQQGQFPPPQPQQQQQQQQPPPQQQPQQPPPQATGTVDKETTEAPVRSPASKKAQKVDLSNFPVLGSKEAQSHQQSAPQQQQQQQQLSPSS